MSSEREIRPGSAKNTLRSWLGGKRPARAERRAPSRPRGELFASLRLEYLEDRTVPTGLDTTVFDSNISKLPGFSQLTAVMEKSPTFVKDINALASQHGTIVLGKPGGGYYTNKEFDKPPVITLEPELFAGMGSLGFAFDRKVALFAHEVGHAVGEGGLSSYTPDITNPQMAAASGLHAEGVADLQEYKVVRELQAAGVGSGVPWTSTLRQTLDPFAPSTSNDFSPSLAGEMIVAAAKAHANLSVSTAKNLTYYELYQDHWIVDFCRIDSKQIDWQKIMPGDFSSVYDPVTGTCSVEGTNFHLLGGGTGNLSGEFLSNGKPRSATYSLDTNGDGTVDERGALATQTDGRVSERTSYPSAGVELSQTYDRLDGDGVPLGAVIKEVISRGIRIDGTQLAGTFGSQLGALLGGDNPFKRIALSSLGGAIGANAALVLSTLTDSLLSPGAGGQSHILDALGKALKGSADGAIASLPSQSISAMSSLIVAEAAEKLGLNGFAGQVLTTAGNTVVAQLLTNINTYRDALTATNLFDKINNVDLIKGFGVSLGAALGAKLGSHLVDIDSVGEALFASVGSSYLSVAFSEGVAAGLSGTISGASASTLLGSLLLPGVGALIGAAIGEVAGSAIYNFLNNITGGLFHKWFDKHPWHYRYVTFDPAANRMIGPANLDFSKDTNSQLRQGTNSLTDAYLETVNSIIAAVGGRVDSSTVTATDGNAFFAYVNSDKYWGGDDYQVVFGAEPDHLDARGDFGRLVRIAVEYQLRRVNFLDGDPNKVKAFNAWKAAAGDYAPRSGDSLPALMSALELAEDVTQYQQNTGVVNALIEAVPDSVFARGWVSTFLQWEALTRKAAETFVAQADARFAAGDVAGGIYGLNRSLEFVDTNPVIFNRLAAKYAETGDLSAAVYNWQRSAGVNDQDPQVWRALGKALLQRNTGADATDGLYALRRASNLAPQDGSIYADIGFAYYAQGDKVNGRAALIRAYTLGAPLDLRAFPAAGPAEIVAYVRETQLPNGALRLGLDPGGYDAAGRVYHMADAYFDGIAVDGLIAASTLGHADGLAAAEKYFRWYLANVKADGTVDVHWYYDDGSEARPASAPDSNDSYASVTLAALWRFYAAGGNKAFFYEPGVKEKIRLLANVLVRLQQPNGLTTTFLDKTRPQALYTQDNSESFAGFRGAADLFMSAYGDPDTAATYLTAAEAVRAGILRELVDPATGLFRVGLFYEAATGRFSAPLAADLTSWYPGTTPLVWPIIFGVVPPTDPIATRQLAAVNGRWDGAHAMDWTTRTDAAAVAYAAALAGDTARAAAGLASATRGPYPTFVRSPNRPDDTAVTSVADAGFELLVSATAALRVTNTNDDGPGSLRQAILRADALGGGEIRFQIPGGDAGYQSGLHAWVVTLRSPLPALTGRVVIAGLSQTGYGGDLNPTGPELILDGSAAGAAADGLVLRGNGNAVEGVSVVGFAGNGIVITGGFSNRVSASDVGVDGTGRAGTGNGRSGLLLRDQARWSLVETNVVSANGGAGIALTGVGTVGNIVRANRIGTTPGGQAAAGNVGPGVQIDGQAKWNLVGGPQSADRNVISGNQHGVYVAGTGTDGNRVEGNVIGLAADGIRAVPNVGSGVVVREGAQATAVGGTAAGAGNVISGNRGVGVELDGANVVSTTVAGNVIGLTTAGDAAGNGLFGIDVRAAAHGNVIQANTIGGNGYAGVRLTGAGTNGNIVQDNRIGTSADGLQRRGNVGPGVQLDAGAKWNLLANNLISGNQHGVYLSGPGTAGNRLERNRIGVDATGAKALPNTGSGVVIRDGAQSTVIGGTAPGTGNVISGNGGSGVELDGAATLWNQLLGNVIGENAAGTAAVGNGAFGVDVRGGSNANTFDGNTIGGNALAGVRLTGGGTNNNVLQNNAIGTAVGGKLAVGNVGPGVQVEAGAQWNVIDNNILSGGLTHGVYVDGPATIGNRIERNRIGVSAAGTALPNRGTGVLVQNGAKANAIGGAGVGNVIAANGQAGIALYGTDPSTTKVVGNTIGSATAGGPALPNATAAVTVGVDAPAELLSYFADIGDGIRLANAIAGAIQTVSINPVGSPPPANLKNDPRPLFRAIVPVYFPVPGGQVDWNAVIGQNVPSNAEVMLVVNIGTGAGGVGGGPNIPAGWDAAVAKSFYRQVLVEAYRRGIKLLGYVSTDYGNRPLADVQKDVAAWKSLWPGMTGVFLDEQAAGTTASPALARTRLDYYKAIRTNVLNLFGPTENSESDPRVVTNPGTFGTTPQDLTAYLGDATGVPVADIMLVHESASLAAYAPPAWVTNYEKGRFAVLLHHQAALPTAAALSSVWAGNVYVTDDGADGNAWDRLPTYWGAEIGLLTQLNAVPAARSDTFSTPKNTALTVPAALLANDRYVAGHAVTATRVSGPAHGTLTLGANGSFTYTPTTGYVGPDAFTYKVVDGAAASNVATVSLTVAAAPATRFAVTVPAAATAGVSVVATVTALDQYNDPTTNYSGTVHLTTTDASAALPADAKLTNGVGTFAVTLKTAGDRTVTATDTVSSGVKGVSAAVRVAAAAAARFGVTAPVYASTGTPFNIVVTAFDAFGNTATGYAGTVRFTSTDATAVLPANAKLTNGVGTFAVTLKTPGSRTVTATDTVSGSVTGGSAPVQASGPAARFSIAATAATAGTALTVTVTALDASGNVSTGYAGTVRLTSGDATAVLPADAKLTNGVGTFVVTLKKAGAQTVTATDTVTATLVGSATVTVAAAAAARFAVGAPATATAGASAVVTVTALDAFGNTAAGYAGTVRFTSTDATAALPANGKLTNGVGTFAVTFKKSGSQTVTAADTANALPAAASGSVSVAAGATARFAVGVPAASTAGGAVAVTVTALDAYGNTAAGYAGTVRITSGDATAVLPANAKLVNGVGTFSVTLKRAGSQTVTAADAVSTAITTATGTVVVAPAAAARFVFSLPPTALVNGAVSVTVTAVDAYGNTATGYAGTVKLTSTDATAVLPAPAKLTNGVGTFTVIFKKAGVQTVTAVDTLAPALTGVSAAVTVR